MAPFLQERYRVYAIDIIGYTGKCYAYYPSKSFILVNEVMIHSPEEAAERALNILPFTLVIMHPELLLWTLSLIKDTKMRQAINNYEILCTFFIISRFDI